MDTEKLNAGNDLKEQIEKIQLQKAIWEKARKINNLQITSKPFEQNAETNFNINENYVDFEVLRTLTLSTINKKLTVLLDEFKAL